MPIQAYATDEHDAARAASSLRNEKAPSMSGNSAEGNSQNTNHHEGEPAMTTVPLSTETPQETDAEQRAADWLDEHPEASEAVPSWTDELELDFDSDNRIYFTAGRDIGEYELRQTGEWHGGEIMTSVTLALWNPREVSYNAESARELAAYARARAIELLTVAATLEAEDAR